MKFRAPGRVNLIGEHTDYNDGFVFPAAINFDTTITASPRTDRRVNLTSAQEKGESGFDLDSMARTGTWIDYVQGVAFELEAAGYRLVGADLHVDGQVPIGAGLSSSAALEVAAGLTLSSLARRRLSRLELAKICQRAENEFVGLRCGIMDQFIACHGVAGKALLLDCRSLEYRLLPIPQTVRLVVCNTMVKHELAGSEYNARRADCEAGARALGVATLRDAKSLDHARLEERIYRRCRHVLTENLRAQHAASALDQSDLRTFGRLMAESHASLRDDYEVSCSELDTMVELAAGLEGVYGARMTGGGFGGCTINLVQTNHVEEFRQHMIERYERSTGVRPDVYVCTPSDGCSEIR